MWAVLQGGTPNLSPVIKGAEINIHNTANTFSKGKGSSGSTGLWEGLQSNDVQQHGNGRCTCCAVGGSSGGSFLGYQISSYFLTPKDICHHPTSGNCSSHLSHTKFETDYIIAHYCL